MTNEVAQLKRSIQKNKYWLEWGDMKEIAGQFDRDTSWLNKQIKARRPKVDILTKVMDKILSRKNPLIAKQKMMAK